MIYNLVLIIIICISFIICITGVITLFVIKIIIKDTIYKVYKCKRYMYVLCNMFIILTFKI